MVSLKWLRKLLSVSKEENVFNIVKRCKWRMKFHCISPLRLNIISPQQPKNHFKASKFNKTYNQLSKFKIIPTFQKPYFSIPPPLLLPRCSNQERYLAAAISASILFPPRNVIPPMSMRSLSVWNMSNCTQNM